MSAAAPSGLPFSGPVSTEEPQAQSFPEPATSLPLDPESSSTSGAGDSLAAAATRLVSDLVESGSERVAQLLEQAGNLTNRVVEAVGKMLGALLGGGADGAPRPVEQLFKDVGGLLGQLSQALGQALTQTLGQALSQAFSGSSGPPAPSSGGPGAHPAVPPPAAPAVPSGPAPASYTSFISASGSATDVFPLLLAVLCALAIAQLKGGKLSYHCGLGRLSSTALRLTVERPG